MSKISPAKTAAKKVAAKTVAKPSAKGAPAKAPVKAAAKPAAKPAVPTVQINVRRTVKGKPVFVINETARPGAGRSLFAHTNAALIVTGMLQAARPSVPKATVLTIMGQRAVTYHLKQGNFEDSADHGIRLSSSGYAAFSTRPVDAKMTNAFIDLFLDGKTADTGIAKGNLYQSQA